LEDHSLKIKKELAEPIIWIAAVLLLWEFVSRTGIVNAFLTPPPSVVFYTMLNTPALWYHSNTTLFEVVVGFSSAGVFGIGLAVIVSFSKHIERALYPIVIFFQSVPMSALSPLFIAWVGFGFLPKAMIAFLITFFPILVNAVTGLTIIEPEMLDMMNALHATRWQMYRKIRLPKSLPYIFTAFKIAAPLSVIGAVNAEFFSGNEGLGYLVLEANCRVNIPLLFSSLVCMAAMGIGLFVLVILAERLLMPWYKK
jgi:NitT/TauT family transport system permease protein